MIFGYYLPSGNIPLYHADRDDPGRLERARAARAGPQVQGLRAQGLGKCCLRLRESIGISIFEFREIPAELHEMRKTMKTFRLKCFLHSVP